MSDTSDHVQRDHYQKLLDLKKAWPEGRTTELRGFCDGGDPHELNVVHVDQAALTILLDDVRRLRAGVRRLWPRWPGTLCSLEPREPCTCGKCPDPNPGLRMAADGEFAGRTLIQLDDDTWAPAECREGHPLSGLPDPVHGYGQVACDPCGALVTPRHTSL